MSNKEIFDDLHKFFLKVNKMRTDVMRKENPTDSYDYFPKDEEPEFVIRKGMQQYEDLVKRFKRMERKGGIKLSKDPDIQPPNIKTTKPKKEENTQSEVKESGVPKKRKISGTEEVKDAPKKRKISGTEEGKDVPKKRKVSGTEEEKDAPKKRKVSGTEETKETKETTKKKEKYLEPKMMRRKTSHK